MSEPWWLYFLECKGGSIYIGIAKDVQARFDKHVSGKGARYTIMYKPIRVLACCEFPSRAEAMRAELEMKKLTPLEKRQWAFSYGWDDPLSKQLPETPEEPVPGKDSQQHH